MAEPAFIGKIADSISNALEGNLSHGKKNGIIAAILSFLIPGLGQIYTWEVQKGTKFLIIAIVLYILTIVLAIFMIGFLFGILELLFAIYAAYDAYKCVQAHNASCGE